jgi:hypothetical protein
MFPHLWPCLQLCIREHNVSFPLTSQILCFFLNFISCVELLDDAIQRSKRRYKRCGKLVLASAGTTVVCETPRANNSAGAGTPLLCFNCAQQTPANVHQCIVCDADCTSTKFQGKICKACAPRKVTYCNMFVYYLPTTVCSCFVPSVVILSKEATAKVSYALDVAWAKRVMIVVKCYTLFHRREL